MILRTEKVSKFFTDPVKFQVLKEIDFAIEKGELARIVGKSGC